MNSEEYEQQKTEIVDKYMPWIENGINASMNKTIDVTIDWSGFDQLAPQDGVEAAEKLMDMIRTVGPIIRGMLVAESFDQRQLVRTRIDGLRFEYTTDTRQPLVSNNENTLVFRVLAGIDAASRDDLWTAADVINTMPQSPNPVAQETPFDYWQISVNALNIPQLQNKLSELSAKDLTIDVDWDSFGRYRNLEDLGEITQQLQELIRRVQFTFRGMLFTGGSEERQLVRTRVDGILFGHAANEKQPVMSSKENTLVFLLSTDGKPIEKDHLFFNLPEVVKAMPKSPNPSI